MKRLLLASVASIFVISSASAQQAKPMSGMDMKGMDMKGMDMKTMEANPNDPVSTKGYKAAMMKMMEGAPKKFTGDADIDFMSQMRVHHQGAIDMAKVVLANGKDAEVKKLAQDIVTAQEKEIATIDTWLKAKGVMIAKSTELAPGSPVEGQVVKVDVGAGKLTLKHGPIKNLDMDSMTMVFRVKDPAMLSSIKSGDKVKFVADRVDGALTVTKIEKAN